jgi:hypothetical protein
MGEKAVQFKTSLSVQECGERFRSGISSGRGVSSMIGGVYARLLGGESLDFYTPQHSPPGERPALKVGVAVPKAYGAHMHGTNVHMYVWNRGSHRDVIVAADHSLAGGMHATKLIDAVRSQVER